MNKIDLFKIREDVFKQHGIPVATPGADPPHEILMRAHYHYSIDTEFDIKVREMKENHQRFIAQLLENVNNV